MMSREVIRALVAAVAAALIVQGVALGVARPFGRRRMFLGWGVAAVLRLIALLCYAFLVIPALGLAPVPALLTLGGSFVLSVLLEPFLLRRVLR